MTLDGELINSSCCKFDTAPRSLCQVRGISTSNGLMRHTYDRSCRSVLLQAATAAASAEMPFRLHVDVTQLARHAGHAMPKVPVEDQAPAHTGPQRVHGHAIHVASGAEPFLTHRG